MMKTILIPTDFSANARNALDYVVQLSRFLGCRLILLHTFSTHRRGDMLISLEDRMRRDAEDSMNQLGKHIPEDIHWEYKIMVGDTVDTIVDQAKHCHADLIVMGTKGASGWEEVFIGSVTGGVMKAVNIPLLAIPAGFTYEPIEKIVLAMTNLKVSAPEEVFRPLKTLAEKSKASIQVYHHDQLNNELPEEVVEVIEWLGDVQVNLTFEQDEEEVNKNISDFVEATAADMLCMVRRNRSNIGFFERIFRDSVTLNQVFHCEVPLLILHAD
ncbi:MAG: universal stress protein [Saprospiraceae bacterium]